MPRLTEKYVQKRALAYLTEYYSNKHQCAKIFSQAEVKTIYKRRPGRADGLIAFKKNRNRIYTASLEAKSHKTFQSLKNIARDTALAITFGVSTLVMALVTWLVLESIVWWLKLIIAVVVGLAIGSLVVVLLLMRELFDTNGIIEQVKRYPADEQWIAISTDAYNKYNSREGNKLLLKAKASGIGLVLVSAGNKAEIRSEAKQPKILSPRSYVFFYTTHKRIIDFLNS